MRNVSLLHSADEIRRITTWNKGRVCVGLNPDEWREDDYGSLIQWSAYGDRSSPYGWELDHYPVPNALASLGSGAPPTFRPLHWRRNASLGGLLGSALSEGRAR